MKSPRARVRLLGSLVRDFAAPYRPPTHRPDGELACSCGRAFASRRARSQHFHGANNRRRRMGV